MTWMIGYVKMRFIERLPDAVVIEGKSYRMKEVKKG
jgi:hypothetical protein